MAPSSEVVFITGATGFIGSQVAYHTLQAGYRVRLSIRRIEQATSVRSWLPTNTGNNVDFVHIPDFQAPGAFDNALQGVDYIFHLASPLSGQGSDVRKDYVEPAVEGTLGILRAAKKHAKIKLVVVMSSVAALVDQGSWDVFPTVPKANTDERMNVDLDFAFPDGPQGDSMKYAASKILAHQATRDFINDEQPFFKVLSFHPCFVLGQSLIQKSFLEMDGVNGMFWRSLSLKEPFIPSAFVDVRQCAEAHIKAIQRLSSLQTGREYLLASPSEGWKGVVRYLRDEFPDVEVNIGPGPFPVQDSWVIDTRPAVQELGIEWKDVNETVRETLIQQLEFRRWDKAYAQGSL